MITLLTQILSTTARSFVKNEKGAVAVEYGLLVTLIALAIIGGAVALAAALNGMFQAASGALQ